jgi:PAS domain S-box-containing protein
MWKWHKKILFICFFLLFCHIDGYGKSDSMQDTIRVVGDIYYNPYQMLGSNHQPEGMAVDLIAEVMRRMNLNYTLHMTTKRGMYEALKSKEKTIVLGLTASSNKPRYIKFGLIYRYIFESMVCRRSETAKFNNVEDMRGKRIMVEDSSYPEQFLREKGFSKELIPVKNLKDAFLALLAGKCDVIFCPGEVAYYVIDELDIADVVDKKDASLDPVKYGMASNDSVLLSKIVETVVGMKQDGTYDEIYNKWFYNADRTKEYLKVLDYIGFIAILLVAFVIILRIKVKNAKKELAEKNRILEEKEKHLSELLKRYTVLFNNTTVGTLIYDAEGYLLTANNSSLQMFGLKDEKTLLDAGINIFDNPLLQPYLDQNNLEPIIKIIKNDFDEMKKIRYFKDCARQGQILLEIRVTPVYDDQHQLIDIIVNMMDVTEKQLLVTELQNYADKMRFILTSSDVETWEYYPDSQKCVSNSANGRVETRDLQSLIEIVDPDDSKSLQEVVAKMKRKEVDTFSMKAKFTLPSGETQYRSINGTAVKNDAGVIIHYSGLSHNITDLITVQNRLEREKQKAQMADRLKSAFLENMSHEIRTPLNSIVGFSQMLAEEDDNETRQHYVDIILNNNDILLHLIDNILALSKIETGVVEVHYEEFNLVAFIDEICDTFTYNMKSAKVKLLRDIPFGTYKIKTDMTILMQIVYNIVSNAFKFTSNGHVKVGYMPENDGVKIYVEDTGIGIAKDKYDVIFNSFEKIDLFTQGVGLGLSICKAGVKLLNGKISVISEEGKGTTFTVWIPRYGS